MPDREFLERYPLYRKFNFEVPADLTQFPRVAVNMDCSVCQSSQTFTMDHIHADHIPSQGKVVPLSYSCQHCGMFKRWFLVKIAERENYIMKVGQYPAWDAGNKDIENRLGEHASYYKRGLSCESYGYGIGAFAYYRRIVEEIIDGLLDEVSGLLTDEELKKYQVALARTKETRQTANKIALVQDLLPPILRPDNMNPLSALHGALGEGLHAESDEQFSWKESSRPIARHVGSYGCSPPSWARARQCREQKYQTSHRPSTLQR
jgi:hypothetical protein